MQTINKKALSERDICTKFITPAVHRAGWDVASQIREEVYFTAGRIIVRGKLVTRGKANFADYILYYKPNIPLALIEAKDNNHSIGDGMQQALKYAASLDIPFVFSSNGDGFVFHDGTGQSDKIETNLALDAFPSPEQLWAKYRTYKGLTPVEEEIVLQNYYEDTSGKEPRYYQSIAINKTIEAIAKGQDRILLVMATGTGKTYTAFQIIWRLWKAGRKKRILFLADRNVLIDQTLVNDFRPFGAAMAKLSANSKTIERFDGTEVQLPTAINPRIPVEKHQQPIKNQDVAQSPRCKADERPGEGAYIKYVTEPGLKDNAANMRQALINENPDLVLENKCYIMRITGDDKEGCDQLGNFIDPEAKYPVIITTSRLLSTGVDAQTCRLIVLDREVGSMTEFKQIMGRGTRVHKDTKKYYFTLMDFRKATNHFADPDFDGEPVQIYEPEEDGPITPPDDMPPVDEGEETIPPEPDEDEVIIDYPQPPDIDITMIAEKTAKYYINGQEVSVLAERVQYLDEHVIRDVPQLLHLFDFMVALLEIDPTSMIIQPEICNRNREKLVIL